MSLLDHHRRAVQPDYEAMARTSTRTLTWLAAINLAIVYVALVVFA